MTGKNRKKWKIKHSQAIWAASKRLKVAYQSHRRTDIKNKTWSYKKMKKKTNKISYHIKANEKRKILNAIIERYLLT